MIEDIVEEEAVHPRRQEIDLLQEDDTADQSALRMVAKQSLQEIAVFALDLLSQGVLE